jgi:transcriptional regulator with PAS, ATPase and Fis domain
MREVFRIVQRICNTESSVLITGESGTGKELIARTIHSKGQRSSGPFVPVNCAAIPAELLESEFFGHEKGSFTGAHARRVGKFELAMDGVMFLDEISTLRQDLQAKLLRVLQEREFTRVGGSQPIRVNAQIISATNQDLRGLITERQFREDLYYRLNVLPVHLPPLRERNGDIPLLVRHFLEKIAYRLNRKASDVTPEAMEVLKTYHWPGNIREMENLLERVVAFSVDHNAIDVQDLPNELVFPEPDGDGRIVIGSKGLLEARDKFEKMYILSALRKSGWNQSEAARVLGIHRNTLIKKMASHGLEPRRG